MEKDSGDTVGSGGYDDPTIARTNRGSYEDFFSRPVRLASYSWNENSAFPFTYFNPWAAYFLNTQVVSKLKGFSRLRANLRLKFVVNGSPFRYGDVMVAYRPLFDLTAIATEIPNRQFPFFSGGQIGSETTLFYPGGTTPGTAGDDKASLLARSQRMNIHLLPQTNTGGEMLLPFIYYKDAIALVDTLGSFGTSDMAFYEMGTITMQNVVNLLSTAAANASPVTITIFAWAENVEIWGPTNATIQFKDEFGDTMKPSQVASAVADAAGKLSSVPVIGPYALATRFAASCVSSVLRLFGWSNPPVIMGVAPIVPKTSFLNPNPLTSYADDVVAMDPKNEVTVDPRTVGADPTDDLIISKFCAREAIFDTVAWNVADAPLTYLATLPVSPLYCQAMYINNTATPSQQCTKISMTPAAYAAQLFRYWRGTFCLKIRTVASQFHRGRLAVSWDPSPIFATQLMNAQITDILDLASANEIVFKVPYMATTGLLEVLPYGSTANTAALVNSYTLWGNRSTSSSLTNLSRFCNGVVYVSVLNELQCGDATAAATLVLSTWFEDMELVMPAPDLGRNSFGTDSANGVSSISYNNFTAQGLEAPDGETVTDSVEGSGSVDMLAALYAGETVLSLRSLLHRTYFYRSILWNNTAQSLVSLTVPRFPVPFHNKGILCNENISGQTGMLGTLPTNMVTTTPIAYLTGCFVGYRGSMVWKACSTESYKGVGCYWSALGRCFGTQLGLGGGATPTTSNGAENTFRSYFGSLLNGVSSSFQSNNGIVSGVFPMYSRWRMHPGNVATMYTTLGTTYADSAPINADMLSYVGVTNTSGNCYTFFTVAAGTDFNVFQFVNVPDVYLPTAF